MRFGKFRLQLKRAVGQRTRFLPSLDRAFVVMQDPTFQLRVARHGKGEVRVEFDCPLEELLALFEFLEILKAQERLCPWTKAREASPFSVGLRVLCAFSLGDNFARSSFAIFCERSV